MNGGIFIIHDFILDALNLPKDEVDSVDYQLIDNTAHIFVVLKKIVRICPHCNHPSQKTNGTQTTTINHGLFTDRPCLVHLKKYRYICSICNTTFMTYSFLSRPRSSISLLSQLQIMEMAKDEHFTFNMMASKLNISTTSVINTFIKYVPSYSSQLPEVLCFDEVYLGRKSRKKYAGVLMDFTTGKLVDFIYGRSVEDCIRSLGNAPRNDRYNVKYVSTDMYSGFIRAASTLYPKAKICIDSFHVITLIINGYSDLIKQIRKSFDKHSVEYYLLKSHRDKLLMNQDNIDWYKGFYSKKLGYFVYNYRIKELLFDIHPHLSVYYQLKEDYIGFNRSRSVSSIQFDNIIKSFNNSNINQLQNCAKTLIKHKQYILNSFTRINGRRISNGPIESRNSTIKLLLRNSSGYRNFKHLRKRVLYVLNEKASFKKGKSNV